MKILTGMHRSGTSLAARLLHLTGADLGDPAGFYPTDRWNPEGYFEQKDVRAINCQLLHGKWGRLAYFRLPSPETIRHRAVHIAEDIHRLDHKYNGLLVKDPRFSLTLPEWEMTGLRIEKLLICIREPSEVATSLQRRNWITQRMGLRLWEEHYRRILAFVQNRNVWWIRYSHLTDSRTNIEELTGALSFLGLAITDFAKIQSAIRTIRERPKAKPVAMYEPPLIDLWDDLCKRHEQQIRR